MLESVVNCIPWMFPGPNLPFPDPKSPFPHPKSPFPDLKSQFLNPKYDCGPLRPIVPCLVVPK